MGQKKQNNIRYKTKKVLIDTNFLLLPGQYKFDIFSEIEKVMNFEYKLYIVDRTLDELEKISSGGTKAKLKDRIAAKIAVELLERQKVDVLNSKHCKGRIVDDLIVELSDEDTIVCTNDKELKKELLSKGFAIIELMKKSYLRINKKKECD